MFATNWESEFKSFVWYYFCEVPLLFTAKEDVDEDIFTYVMKNFWVYGPHSVSQTASRLIANFSFVPLPEGHSHEEHDAL